MAKLKLNAKRVESLRASEVQEDFWDGLTPGLCLRVSGATGRKTWLLRYRVRGDRVHHHRMKLGVYPELDLADAREKARAALAKADAGIDPAHEREEHQGTPTFREMADEVLKALESRTREKTQTERRRILNKELLPEWGDRPAGEVTRRDVLILVEAIRDRGAPILANRVLSLIGVLFNGALARGFPTVDASPAHMLRPPAQEYGRDRWLTAKEIRAVWKATEPENPLTRGAFRLALLTGQRVGSIVAMRWDLIEQNGTGGIWRVPEEDFKGRRPHLVPLSAEAWAVLEDLRSIADEGARYVFPARARTRVAHVTNLGKALARVRARTRLKRWTAHDFRTTFRTHAVKAPEDGGCGVAPNVADLVLGHAENSLGWSRYQGDRDHYLLHEKREALRAWGAFVRKAVEGEE